MKTIWQVAALALRGIAVSLSRTLRNKQTTFLPRTHHWRSIGAAALLACAFLLPAFGAAQAATATTTTLASSANPSQVNQSVTFTATVSGSGGSPTGTVTFTDLSTASTIGTGTISTVGGQQQASVTTSFGGVSTHNIQASYNGDSTFAGSTSSTLSQMVVSGTATTTTLASSANPSKVNQSVTFTATVSGSGGSPTGTVTFNDLSTASTIGTATISTVGGQQQASVSISFAAVSTHNIQATYNGDSTFAGSTSSTLSQMVVSGTATTTTLASSANRSKVNQSVTFTATVSGSGGAPTGTVTFNDLSTASTIGTATISTVGGQQQATVTTSFPAVSTHNIQATYNGDSTFAGSTSNTVSQMVLATIGSTTTLTSSPNPSAVGQAVTFTATVKPASGSLTPTGTVTFKDNGTTIGTGTLSSIGGVQTATFTTSALTAGSHPITAVYSGDTNFSASTSAVLVQNVNSSSDSTKLREMQVSTTPVIAAAWGATTSSAMDDAVSAGFGGNPQSLSPAGTGFTYYFNDDAPAQPKDASDEDTLRRFLASPNGSLTSPNGNSASPDGKSAAANDSVKRVDDDFRALGYAGGMPTKAPPPPSSTPHDWLAWVTVRGTDYFRNTFGNDLKGDQVDVLAGLTRRISKDFVVGAFGGYEHFDYSSQAFNAVLKGDGWTVGAYLGWKLAPNIRLDAGGAWSAITANDTAGTANGNFTGTRWLINGGITGTYPWQMLVLEPSARVFAIWEHEKAFTDSLGTFQPARNFETGRASAGVKAIYPFAWTSSTVALSPYAGLYADYYFSKDDAQTAGLTTVPLLQGFSARVTGGVAASFAGGATLGAGGEFGGIGSATHIWTWTARGRIPF